MLLLHDEDELPLAPSEAEKNLILSLGKLGLEKIDNLILSELTDQWKKVAMVIFNAMEAGGFEFTEESVDLHARRVIHLSASGSLCSTGNLHKPRFSEVKL